MTTPVKSTVDLRIRFGPEKHRRNIDVEMSRGRFAAAFTVLIFALVITALLLASLFVMVYIEAKGA